MKKLLASAAAVAGLLLAVQTASAVPRAPSPQADEAQSLIVPVHGCHYDNRYSPGLGWHNHSNAECRPEPARRGPPPGYYAPPVYQQAPPPRRRGHDADNPCHFDCRFSPQHGWHNHSNAQCRPEPCRRGGGW
jgi:hypothetical protein